MKIQLCNMRLSGNDKRYYESRLQEFADLLPSTLDRDIASVQFGKQDTRGGFSITLVDQSGCVPMQKFFDNKSEMLGFVIGYLSANSNQKYL